MTRLPPMLALAAVLVGSGALAEDRPAPADVAQLETCLAEQLPATDRAVSVCIRLLAERCMAQPDGGTTFGMAGCMRGEADAWDVLLNRDWPRLMARARGTDEAYAGLGADLPSAAKTLRDAQRAWLAWRDAECLARAAEWGDGSHRHIAWADCWLQLTAERTIRLRARLAEEP